MKNLLSVTPAPLEIADGIPALKDHIVSEENESNLTMVDKILTAIGWRMQIQGDGTISILPEPDSASALFDPIELDYGLKMPYSITILQRNKGIMKLQNGYGN